MEKVIIENELLVEIGQNVKKSIPSMEGALSFMRSLSTIIEGIKLEDNQYLSTDQVLQLLNVSDRTLQNYRSKGLLKYEIIGHEAYYSASEIKRFQNKQIAEKNKEKSMRGELEELQLAKKNNNR